MDTRTSTSSTIKVELSELFKSRLAYLVSHHNKDCEATISYSLDYSKFPILDIKVDSFSIITDSSTITENKGYMIYSSDRISYPNITNPISKPILVISATPSQLEAHLYVQVESTTTTSSITLYNLGGPTPIREEYTEPSTFNGIEKIKCILVTNDLEFNDIEEAIKRIEENKKLLPNIVGKKEFGGDILDTYTNITNDKETLFEVAVEAFLKEEGEDISESSKINYIKVGDLISSSYSKTEEKRIINNFLDTLLEFGIDLKEAKGIMAKYPYYFPNKVLKRINNYIE